MRRRATPWILLELAIALPVGAALAVPLLWGLLQLQPRLCPAESFLAVPTPAGALLAIAVAIAVVAGPALLVGRAAAGRHVAGRSWQRALWVAAMLLPVTLPTTLPHACVTARVILVQSTPWADAQLYGWDEVRRVDTRCDAGWLSRPSFGLTLADGEMLELYVRPAAFAAAYPRLAAALHGRRINFAADAGQCAPDLRPMFAVSPAS